VQWDAVCKSVLQRVAVFCSVFIRVWRAVFSRVWQCCSESVAVSQRVFICVSRGSYFPVCCSVAVLQCAAVCRRVLQCVAACCSVFIVRLQGSIFIDSLSLRVCCSALQGLAVCYSVFLCGRECCSVLQRVAAYLCVSRGLYFPRLSLGKCVAVCCSVLQCVSVCRRVLQCVAA